MNKARKVEFNKTYEFTIKDVSFGDLTLEEVYTVLKDGRVASHFLERQLAKWFPQLTHITGNKAWDHLDETGAKYDAKNFTSTGLKFMPSGMLGKGRKYCPVACRKKIKENRLSYIMCDIVEFPKIRVKFSDGLELLQEYPRASIPKSHREVIFG